MLCTPMLLNLKLILYNGYTHMCHEHKQQNKNIFTRFREKNNNGELLKNVFESNVCKK